MKLATKNLDIVPNESYGELCTQHLLTHKRTPQKFDIHKIPIAQLLNELKFSPGDLDDGLMHIGTKFCFNTVEPDCNKCPINKFCEGNMNNKKLINDYST